MYLRDFETLTSENNDKTMLAPSQLSYSSAFPCAGPLAASKIAATCPRL